MNKLISGIRKTTNRTASTGNGALSNKSTLSATLDFFGAGGALRLADETRVTDLFGKAFGEDRLTAMKTLFYFRDIRGGQGERKTFRTAILYLANFYPEVLRKNLALIPVYGRWDDLFVLEGTPVWNDVVTLVDTQLVADKKNVRGDKEISLLAKWMPSINTSSPSTRALAKVFIKAFDISAKEYRKMLSRLRKKIVLVESLMSAGKFGDIDYSKVPSRAGMIYRKAFSKRDAARYVAFLAAVEKGEVKINAGTLYPYDIVRNVLLNGRGGQTLDAQWNALTDYIKEPKNALVIADVSDSMTCGGEGNVRPIDVSISLAIYIAERNKGAFKDYFMTFSTTPTLQKVVGKTIGEKVNNLSRAEWAMSTNLQAAFDLILTTARRDNLSQEELPETLFVISDMQFNQACGRVRLTNFELIDKKFEAFGYTRPNLVFWNVNAAGSKQFPITVDDAGTAIVSGCSPSILASVLNNETITPQDVMDQTINVPRYDAITV
jgi:hypothetical protein